MKEGKSKVKTLIIEDVKDLQGSLLEFDGDVNKIAIIPGIGVGLGDLLENLRNLKLYHIVPKPDPNLEGLIEMDYHAIDPINVTDANFTDPDDMIFNGDIRIPWEGQAHVTVVGGYFMNEDLAEKLCRDLNVHTSKRVDALAEKLVKSQKFRRDIANDSMS